MSEIKYYTNNKVSTIQVNSANTSIGKGMWMMSLVVAQDVVALVSFDLSKEVSRASYHRVLELKLPIRTLRYMFGQM